MEFLDEDARPRFLFQSRPPPPPSTSSLTNQTQNPTKPYLFLTITTSISSLLLLLSILYLQTEPLKSLLFWLSLSLFLGPFAPSHLTAGHIRVGHGPILQPLTPLPEPEKKPHQKRSKPVRSDQTFLNSSSSSPIIEDNKNTGLGLGLGLRKEQNGVVLEEETTEWSEEDFEILKKQLAKNPVGKIGRWEIISEAFKGKHKVENVIKKAKELSERKLDGGDDYARFLKNRKPLDNVRGNSNGGNEVLIENDESKKENDNDSSWSSGEDIALLNALKAFPKDVAMRWEKIAAAVPGKTKAACVKRVAVLKRDFRSSKAGGAEG